MRSFTKAGAALLALAAASAAAIAAGPLHDEPGRASPRFAETLGRTLPPVGFVTFCGHHPEACRPGTGRSASLMRMTAQRWRQVHEVNRSVNASVAPVSDQDLYGQNEFWAYAADAGDCEDYVLLKKRVLEGLGFARSALLITVVRDEKDDGHAVLTLRTTDGDFILDNRRDEVRRWNDLDYTYLKRQSEKHPREWVSLGGGHASDAMVAGGTAAR
jgi:predicted transglutaminase-like cysteine proteinase